MSDHRVRLIGTEQGLRSLSERLPAITAHWPETFRKPDYVQLEINHEVLHDASREIAIDDGAVLLVGVPEGTPSPAIYKTIDLLRAARISAVLLLDDCSSDTGRASGGVISLCSDTKDEVVAATLHALCSRQETIDDLSRDLSISIRSSGGVREEMERISQELSLASTIQRELIPKHLPTIEGVEFGVLYRPAGFVSGDIYSIQPIDDRHVGFFIADAIGHGVPAALLTMIISRALNIRGGTESGRILSPSDALARLNDDLCDVSDGNPRFATAVYGIMDTTSGIVRLANAGHPAAIRIGDAENYEVEAGGPLLGVFHDAEFPEETIELSPGETLLLYSDGFEVAFPDTAQAVTDTQKKAGPLPYLDHLLRIGQWMDKGKKSLACALSDLEAKLDEASGSLHQADDVTALAISRLTVSSKTGARASA